MFVLTNLASPYQNQSNFSPSYSNSGCSKTSNSFKIGGKKAISKLNNSFKKLFFNYSKDVEIEELKLKFYFGKKVKIAVQSLVTGELLAV